MATIGRFRIERELGRGSMGVVYLAFDPRVRRPVAIKTIHVPVGLDAVKREEFRSRFLREAQAAGSLSHPGIVTVFDADDDAESGGPFIAMEYVDGRSLADVLADDAPLEPDRARALIDEVAAALGAAHESGVVHRDVKPANILISDRDGRVKLADFGVARIASSDLTRTGTSVGSPAYMSPEQIRGARTGAGSDLFSLAVVLYEALTGKRPFAGEDLSTLVYSVVHETPVPVCRIRPELPRGLDTFFDRALAKKPEDRFSGAGEFREALARAMTTDAADPCTGTLIDPTSAITAATSSGPRSRAAVVAEDEVHPSFGYGTFVRIGRNRPRRRVAIGISSIAVVALGLWLIVGAFGRATLRVEGRSAVPNGEIAILVDGDEVFSHDLYVEGGNGRGKGLLRKIKLMGGIAEQEFETQIRVRPGTRTIAARLIEEGDPTPYEDTLVIDVESGDSRTIRLVAGRAFGSPLSLRID